MLGRILNKTKGKPCSCPEGKRCEHCKTLKKTVHPRIYIEEPRRLTVPIVISHYKPPPTTEQYTNNSRRWSINRKEKPTTQAGVGKNRTTQWYKRKNTNTQPSPKKTRLCQWYKRNKALKELKQIRKKELQLEEQARREQAIRKREQELTEYFKLKEEYKDNTIGRGDTPVIKKKEKVKKVKVKKEKIKKEKVKPVERKTNKTSSAKPTAESRYVSVKRRSHYRLSQRYVSCFYRVCGHLFCYINFFIVFSIFFIVIIFA